MAGAMIRAMLAAYRRTLEKTMAQARSMGQVVDEAELAWLETPDQAMVWGAALGLQREVEGVLERSRRGRPGRPSRSGYMVPGLVRQRRASPAAAAAAGGGGGLSSRADPRLRRDDGGARHGRQLAVVVGRGGGGGFGGGGWRRRRRRRRRLLGLGGFARYTRRHGCRRDDGEFFEKLNAGDREGAVALMDERAEMRVHVGDNAQTLRGIDRVGGWFLRGDRGLKMIPGDVRDIGKTYEADIVVIRPGRPSPAPRRHVPGRGRQDHLDQPRPALAADARPAPAAISATGRLGAEARRAPPSCASMTSLGAGDGIVISSPTAILFGFLIGLFAASSWSTVTLNFLAILMRCRPA